ncbi:hypothetical protein V8C35DRAFT_303217 [Trichoderma chlorosporum]
MASTSEGGNPAHKMKRTAKPLYKRNLVGVAPSSSPSVGDRMRSQTGAADDAPFSMVTSDIVPPAGGSQNGTPIETPVPLPVPMRTSTSMTSLVSALTAKQKSLSTNRDILQAQREWEKKLTATDHRGPFPEAHTSISKPQPLVHADLNEALTRLSSREISEALPQGQLASETDPMAGPRRLPEEDLMEQMADLNRPTAVVPRRRASRAFIVSSSASEYTASASASPSREREPSAPAAVPMDIADDESHRTGLQTNANNESYYTYIDDGFKQSTSNVPIPPGKERYDNGEKSEKLPFVCPVRDCRSLCLAMKQLAAHFHGKHSRSLFNDNGDGTISKVGGYVNEEVSSPGIIISRNPLSPGAPSPAVPEYSESQKRLLNKKSPPSLRTSATGSAPPDTSKRPLRGDASNDGPFEESIPKRPKTTPVPLPVQAASPSPLTVRPLQPPPPLPSLPPTQSSGPLMTDVLRYLHRNLSPSQQVPARIDILALSRYERVRRLPGLWLEHHHDKTLDPLQYACTLAYLVGKVEELNPCGKWKGISRLSEPCVGLPPDLPAEARAAFSKTKTCIACQYQFCCYRTKNECEWADDVHDDGLTVEEAVLHQDQSDKADVGGAAAKVDDYATVQRLVNQGRGLSSSTKQAELPILAFEKKSPPLSNNALPAATAARKPSSAAVAEMEEMEDWEIAPGTMKDETTSTNVAFSNAYLSNQNPIMISPGVSAHVLILKAGHPHQWSPDANKLRTFTVAAGKINVNINNDPEFKTGPNGLIVIRPGHSCKVVNRLYADAVLHCMTYED